MNIRRYMLLLVAFAGFVLTYNAPSYGSEGDKNSSHGPWGVGLRVGPSVLTQHLGTTPVVADGNLGIVLGGEGQYDLNESFSVGFGLEWENHNATVVAVGDVGSVDTITLMPFARYRFVKLDRFHPYLSLGVGMNINSFSLASKISGVSTAGVTSSLKNSFAIKPGIGIDYFVTKALALSSEFDWKLNAAKLTLSAPEAGITATENLNMSSLQLLFGASYHF